jgi:phosphate starvation-inducible protein PhoH and related proteins
LTIRSTVKKAFTKLQRTKGNHKMSKNASRRNNNKNQQTDLRLISNNQAAMLEGPQKKKWTKHDIKAVQPLTDNQKEMFKLYNLGYQICAAGSPGTGKTFLALYLAMCDILDGNSPYNHLRIVRSAVPTRDLGFMKGSYEEKIRFYELPYIDIMGELFHRFSTYDDMKEAGLVRFTTTSYIRGLTWDNTIVVIEEGQNMTWHEINSVMGRIGNNSKVIFTGDLAQTDLDKKSSDKSGMKRFLRTIERMQEFATVFFTTDDIVRSDFVRSWVIASEKTEAE